MRTRALSRRRFLGTGAGVVAGGALSGVGLTGCGLDRSGELGDAENAEITVWTWPDNDQMFLESIPGFTKLHPGIKVKVQGFGGQGLDFNAKLLGALVSGEGPDVAMVEISHVAKFKSKPGFVDLSRPPFNAGRYADRYAEFAWEYAVEDDGRLFALPKNTGPGGMFYRRDVFSKAGLPTDPAEVQELLPTWDQIVTVGRRIARKGERWLLDSPVETVDAIRGQAGVSYFDEDGTPKLNDPVVLEALEFVVSLKKDGIMAAPMTEQERGAAVNSGAIGLFFSGNWFGGLLKNQFAPKTAGKWGVALPPATDGVRAFNYGGDFIGILQASKNKAASWEFIRWVTQDSGSLRTMYGRDLYPAWKPALEEKWINEPDPYYADQNVNEVFSKVSEEVRPPITHELDSFAKTAQSNAINDAFAGIFSPKQALQGAQDEVEAELS